MVGQGNWACLLLGCLFVLGCGKGAGNGRAAERPETIKRLTHLLVLYAQCTTLNQGKTPRSDAEFKALLKRVPKERFAAQHLPDVEALFVSPRDHRPYVIEYARAARGADPTNPLEDQTGPPFAYEQTGVKGKRLVVFTGGQTEEVDEARAKELQLK